MLEYELGDLVEEAAEYSYSSQRGGSQSARVLCSNGCRYGLLAAGTAGEVHTEVDWHGWDAGSLSELPQISQETYHSTRIIRCGNIRCRSMCHNYKLEYFCLSTFLIPFCASSLLTIICLQATQFMHRWLCSAISVMFPSASWLAPLTACGLLCPL